MADPLRLRVGGVPEHFNLPWRLCIEEGAFARLDDPPVEVEWVDTPGGTGEIMAALDDGEIDLATPLTEGAIAAIAAGSDSRIMSIFVASPLQWGVFTAAGSTATTIDDLADRRFAISRFGSGSELMTRIVAAERGWELADDRFVVVGGLDGAVDALPAGRADGFLWNKSMTQPVVDAGVFRRIGVVPTPWPSFVAAARTGCLRDHGPVLGQVVGEVAWRGRRLMGDATLADTVAQRYGIGLDDATDWATGIEWEEQLWSRDVRPLEPVIDSLVEIGRLPARVPLVDLVSPRNGRRTIERAVSHTHTFRRFGGGDMFAEVTLRLEPHGEVDVEYAEEVDQPNVWRRAIEHGVRSGALWPKDADPLIGLRVIVESLREHPIDSKPIAFYAAARNCLAEALDLADTRPA